MFLTTILEQLFCRTVSSDKQILYYFFFYGNEYLHIKHKNCSDLGIKVLHMLKKTEIFNTFFSNTVKYLRIPERKEVNPFADKLSHPILKSIFKINSKYLHINMSALGEHFNFHVIVGRRIQ